MDATTKQNLGNGSYRILTKDQYEKLLISLQKIDALFSLLIGNDDIELPDGVGFLMSDQSEQLASFIGGMETITLNQMIPGKYISKDIASSQLISSKQISATILLNTLLLRRFINE